MSNTKKRALIIAAICIVLGFLVSYFAFSSDDLDWDSVNTVTQLEPVRYPVKEAFRDIHVEAGSGSVRQFIVRLKNIRKYKYFKCPQCHARLRLPRKVGEVTVTCGKCRHAFKQKA